MTVTLSREDAADLFARVKAERAARDEAELVVTRAKLAVLEATAKKNALVATLAAAHGFDPDRPFTFDSDTGTVTQGEAHGRV